MNVFGAVNRPHACRFSRTATKRVERFERPALFFKLVHSEGLAVFVSFIICGLLLIPPFTKASERISSG